MATKRYSPHDLVLQLQSAGLTQKEIGARIGKSVRQVRRYKSGEARPPNETYSTLSRAASGARRKLADQVDIERDGELQRTVSSRRAREHRLPRNVPIPRAVRREIRNYREGKWKPAYGYTLSDWINYDVRGWSLADIDAFIRALHRSSAHERPYVQLVFLAPSEDTSISGTPYLANKRMQRSGSGIRDLGGADETAVIKWVDDHLDVPGRRPMYIAVAKNRMRAMRGSRDE